MTAYRLRGTPSSLWTKTRARDLNRNMRPYENSTEGRIRRIGDRISNVLSIKKTEGRYFEDVLREPGTD